MKKNRGVFSEIGEVALCFLKRVKLVTGLKNDVDDEPVSSCFRFFLCFVLLV